MNDEKPIKSREWRLNEHGQVEPADGAPVGAFTGQEWAAQEWPTCPVCGAPGEPQRLDVGGFGDRFPRFVVGVWECLNDCDPRPALRGRAAST